MDLNDQISAFVNYWAPHDDQREVFEAQLRDLLRDALKAHAKDTKKS